MPGECAARCGARSRLTSSQCCASCFAMPTRPSCSTISRPRRAVGITSGASAAGLLTARRPPVSGAPAGVPLLSGGRGDDVSDPRANDVAAPRGTAIGCADDCAACRREREHAQQRHREAGVFVGRKADFAARPAPRSGSRAAGLRRRRADASSRSVAWSGSSSATASGTLCASAIRWSSVPSSCSAISNERLRSLMRSASAMSAAPSPAASACRIACR